jgi:hypothetical protein
LHDVRKGEAGDSEQGGHNAEAVCADPSVQPALGPSGCIPYWCTLEANALAASGQKKDRRKKIQATELRFAENMPAMEEYLAKQLADVRVDYLQIDRVTERYHNAMYERCMKILWKDNLILPGQ